MAWMMYRKLSFNITCRSVATPNGLASTCAITGSAFTYFMWFAMRVFAFFSSASRAAPAFATWPLW